MDEKFLEMRSKLDVTRSLYTNETNKIKKNFQDLRLKFALANGGKLLDSVRLPRSAPATRAPTSQEGDQGFLPKNDVTIPRLQNVNSGFQSIERSSQESSTANNRLSNRPMSASLSNKILGSVTVKTSLRPLSAASSSTTPKSERKNSSQKILKASVTPHTHISSYQADDDVCDDDLLMEDDNDDNDGENAVIIDQIVEKINRKQGKKFKKTWTPETLNSLIKSGGI